MEETWKIISVYNRKEIGKTIENIEKQIEEEEEERLIIGGDFNMRTGEKETIFRGEEQEERKRRSKNEERNREGEQMIDWVEEKGWNILNRNIEEEEDGNYTYIGARESTVIDYVIVNYEMLNKVERMEVKERIELDHLPLVVTMMKERDDEKIDEKEEEREADLDGRNNKQIPRENRRENNNRENSK